MLWDQETAAARDERAMRNTGIGCLLILAWIVLLACIALGLRSLLVG